MSVIMTMRIKADPRKLEEIGASQPERLTSIAERGKARGVIAHRFYGTDDEVLVADEWPDEESFQEFMAENQSEIQSLIAECGGTGPPEVSFWRPLEMPDKVGWGA